MPKIKLAVCDADTSYRERVVSYLAHHKAEEAEVYAYSKVQLFFEKRKGVPFEIVILGEGFLELVPELEKEGIPILVLVDKRAECVREGCGMEHVPETGVTYHPRYQSMEVLWHKIRVLTAKSSCGSLVKKQLSPVEIVGVYAPGGHEMQLFFSLLYAELLAKQNKVLYLNFMPYMNFYELFGKEDAYNMSDLILAVRDRGLTADKLQGLISEMDGFSYIAPFCNPEDVQEMTFMDYQEMLQSVMECSDYEVIVVDFGMGMEQISKLLDSCQRIFCLTKDGYFYQCQLNQFMEYLSSENAEVEKKVQVVNLPFQGKWIHGGGNLMEQLKWSEFGDFVRRNFSGGKE